MSSVVPFSMRSLTLKHRFPTPFLIALRLRGCKINQSMQTEQITTSQPMA